MFVYATARTDSKNAINKRPLDKPFFEYLKNNLAKIYSKLRRWDLTACNQNKVVQIIPDFNQCSFDVATSKNNYRENWIFNLISVASPWL